MKIWNRQFQKLHLFLAALVITGLLLDAWEYSLYVVLLTGVIWIIAFLKRNAE